MAAETWVGPGRAESVSSAPLRGTAARTTFLFVAALCWGWPGQVGAQSQVETAHRAMGVTFRLVVHASTASECQNAIAAGAEIIDRADQTLSDYLAESEVERLVRSAPHSESIEISAMLHEAIRAGQDLADQSGGAFDVTVGPLSRLWRAAIKRNRLPEANQIDEARALVGRDQIQLGGDEDSPRVRLARAGMRLDFGGIGKGLAADWAIAAMRECPGVRGALIDASGDVVVWGQPADREAWRVALPAQGEVPARHLRLASGAVATSGDAFQFLRVAGKTHSHVVDPRSGWATTHVARVTVIAPTGARADGWATALCVLAPDAALALAENLDGIEAAIVYRTADGELKEMLTRHFLEWVE